MANDDHNKDLGEEVKKAWEDFTKDAEKARGEILKVIDEGLKEIEEGLDDEPNRQYLIAGGVVGAVGLVISLALKNVVLGAVVVGGASLMIGYGVYLYKKDKEEKITIYY